MGKWTIICKEFKNIREIINSDEPNELEILKGLIKICEKYGNEKWNFADDFMELKEELELLDEDDFDIDYYLDEFYDLCDIAGVWLEL